MHTSFCSRRPFSLQRPGRLPPASGATRAAPQIVRPVSGAHRHCALFPWSLARPVLTFACSTWCVFVSSWPVFGSCFVAFRCITGLPSWHFSCMFAPGPRLRRGRDPGFLDLGTLLPAFISMVPFYFDLSWRPVGSTCVFPAPSLTRLVPVPCLLFLLLLFYFFNLFFIISCLSLSLSFLCPAFPFPFLGVSPYGTSFGYLRVLPIGLPLASSTPADSYRWCLLAAHTSFLSVINNC